MESGQFDNLTWIANKIQKCVGRNEIYFVAQKDLKLQPALIKELKTFIKIDNFNNFVKAN